MYSFRELLPSGSGLRAGAIAIALAVLASGCGGGDQPLRDVVARAEPRTEGDDAAEFDGAVGSVPTPTSSDVGIVVDVTGAVRKPGVYRMPPGARVHEAIDAAGGARPGAALGTLNRAAVLVDGQQVIVNGAGAAGAGADAGAAPAAGSGGKVSINSADVAALDALPGIGEVTAERIVASRDEAGPFATLDDLDRVPGIGPAKIESLRTVATA